MKRFFICLGTILGFMILVKSINVISFKVGFLLYPNFEKLDPDNVFMVLTIHHITQALISVVIIFLIVKALKISMKDYGFNLNQAKFNLKAVLIFSAIWTVIQVIGGIITIKLAHMSAGFSFPLNTKNFVGYFLFEILLSGTSEEIIYRALVFISMIYLWKKLFRNERNLHIVVVLCSTMIFMFDHINFTLFPFKITYVNTLQQLTVFIFGCFFGYLMIKTKSIVGPMIAHNLLNGVITLVGLLFW